MLKLYYSGNEKDIKQVHELVQALTSQKGFVGTGMKRVAVRKATMSVPSWSRFGELEIDFETLPSELNQVLKDSK